MAMCLKNALAYAQLVEKYEKNEIARNGVAHLNHDMEVILALAFAFNKALEQVEREKWLREKAEDMCQQVQEQREELRRQLDTANWHGERIKVAH